MIPFWFVNSLKALLRKTDGYFGVYWFVVTCVFKV